jgi:hypothetical protein
MSTRSQPRVWVPIQYHITCSGLLSGRYLYDIRPNRVVLHDKHGRDGTKHAYYQSDC